MNGFLAGLKLKEARQIMAMKVVWSGILVALLKARFWLLIYF